MTEPENDREFEVQDETLEDDEEVFGETPVIFAAGKEASGKRLDQYLTMRLPRVSRSQVQRLIRSGDILVNSRKTKPSYELTPGEEVSVTMPPPPVRELAAEYLPLEILYEDEKMLVVNKPPGIVVHPARGHWSGTLINAVLYHCHNLSNIAPGRPGIVHRLDRDTTGVILFMKEDWSHRHVARQFEYRRTQKEYLAIVEGELEYDNDLVSRPIGRHPSDTRKMAVRIEGGRDAQTGYSVLERFRGYTFVSLAPRTGRTHQIRVHMASIGHAVAADEFYAKGGPVYLSDLMGKQQREVDEEPILARQALHAHRLNIEYPGKKERIEFVAPLPDDMTRFLEELRKHRRL